MFVVNKIIIYGKFVDIKWILGGWICIFEFIFEFKEVVCELLLF